MTEKTYAKETVRKAAEITGLDEDTIVAALKPERFLARVAEAQDAKEIGRFILWLAPDETCRLAASERMADLLRLKIKAAKTLDELSREVPEVPVELELEVFAKERSLVSGLEDAINLCEGFHAGAWQRVAAMGLVADLVGKAMMSEDYDSVHELYEDIRNQLPDCGLDLQIGHRLEEIQLRDLAVVDDWGSALMLLDRPMPPDRPAVARLTVETAIRFAPDAGALKYIMEHGATKDHQDLNRKALLRVLDLVGD